MSQNAETWALPREAPQTNGNSPARPMGYYDLQALAVATTHYGELNTRRLAESNCTVATPHEIS